MSNSAENTHLAYCEWNQQHNLAHYSNHHRSDSDSQTKVCFKWIKFSISLNYWLFFVCFCFFEFIRKKEGKASIVEKIISAINSIIGSILLVWNVNGSFWVYSIYSTVQYNQLDYPNEYCNNVAYLFAFWSITISWIMFGIYTCICTVLVSVIGCVSCCIWTNIYIHYKFHWL